MALLTPRQEQAKSGGKTKLTDTTPPESGVTLELSENETPPTPPTPPTSNAKRNEGKSKKGSE